jgi:hypothetical protein
MEQWVVNHACFYNSLNLLVKSSVYTLNKLGKVNLISRLSSRVTKKYGAGGRILFYFPKEKLLMTILFISTKGVSFNALNMCSWPFLPEIKKLKYKHRGRTPNFWGKRNFYKKRWGRPVFERRAGMIIYQLSWIDLKCIRILFYLHQLIKIEIMRCYIYVCCRIYIHGTYIHFKKIFVIHIFFLPV